MTTETTVTHEWRSHWPLVVAATTGFSFVPTVTYSLGLFMEPLTREFGWSRSDISAGLIIVAGLSIPFAAPVGALIDRIGARPIALLGTTLTIAAVAALSFADGSIAQWLALWTLYAVATLFVKTTVWTAAISRAFSASRGLALGVVLCGTGISQTLTPLIAQPLIDTYGWRHAYQIIAAGWGGAALLMVLLFLREKHHSGPATSSGKLAAAPAQALPGYTFQEAIRTRPILQICAAVLVNSLITVGVSVHLVPILGEAGMTRSGAAALASLVGACAIVGKLGTGALLDRIQGNLIPFACFALPAVALAILAARVGSTPAIALAAAILGLAGGACAQSAVYLVTRYAGLRSYGAVFGVLSSIMGLAMGAAPWFAGKVFDLSGSYQIFLLIGIPGTILAGLLVVGLGPYPRFAARESVPAAASPAKITAR